MSDSETNPEEKKKSPFGIILFLIIILGGLAGAWIYKKQNSEYNVDTVVGERNSENTTETTLTDADIESLSKPRILGDINAPLKISEHSSFTCGACGKFHKETFKKIKADYIDTGKAYLVFDDFPRNQLDVTIGAIARCVPDESYFKFIQLVFHTQSDWHSSGDEIQTIKENAVLAGADANKVEECANSTELKNMLARSAETAYKEQGVNQTPTLIINGSVRVSGLDPYDEIQKALDDALIDIENDKVIDEVEIQASSEETPTPAPAPIETAAGKAEDEDETETAVEEAINEEPEAGLSSGFDLKNAKTPRILGDANAPIKIVEHSSFGCPHCAQYHKDNFPKLKADYIDTGKAYLVFDDFPLSGADVQIGALARCVPEDSYFKFIQYVFENQETWKKQPNFVDYLKQNAMLSGATDESLQHCIDSRELKEAIAQRGHNAYERKGVKGTPTLIINDGNPVSALAPYSELQAILNAALEKEAQ